MSSLWSLFTEVNLLLIVPFILLLAVWFIFGMAQPFFVIADCIDSDIGWKKKLFWLTAMVFSLGLASFIYPWVNPTGRVMRTGERIMISPLIALLGIYIALYCFHDGVREFLNRQLLNLAHGLLHLFSIG